MFGNGLSVRDLGRDLAFLPTRKQFRLFRNRKLSPAAVLMAQIARIEKYGRCINAITYTHFEQALRAARLSERRYQSGEARPLEGLTIALKDEFERAQWPAGFQVAARPYDDLSVLAVASAYATRCPNLFAGGAVPFPD